ncbi:aspartate/glutamate racemase family protein [Fusibacter sp. JL298sf-3]
MIRGKLGVLGGMGPMATSVFFERVIRRTEATCDQDHLDMVILNHATLPDRTLAIATGQHHIFLKAIESDFKAFEQCGVTQIAIPCNTSHYFYKALSRMTSIPIINMVEETAVALVAEGFKGAKIGVLATDGTINSGVYKDVLAAHGMSCVVPMPKEQAIVMDTIYGIKSGDKTKLFEIEHLIDRLVNEAGCSKVVLACTELSLLDLEASVRTYCIDAMDQLVSASILRCGKSLKKG